MFVANRMAKNPVTVTPDTPVDEAASAIKKGHIRRKPDDDTRNLDRKQTPNHHLRAALKRRDIISKEASSVHEEATLEDAALIMYNNKIGGLPVVSSVGAVVGVITETDIFKTFVDVMGLQEGKTRLTLLVDNKVGVVYDIAGIFTECGLSIDSLVTCRQPYGKYEIVVRGNIPNVDEISEKIKAKGYEIIHTARIG